MKSTKHVLREWHRLVNMTPAAVSAWRRNPRHKLASNVAGWSSLARIDHLLRKSLHEWNDADWAHAAKVVNFNTRHLASQQLFGAEVGRSGWSKRAIALRNWGHDPSDVTSPAKRADDAWLRAHPGALERRHDK